MFSYYSTKSLFAVVFCWFYTAAAMDLTLHGDSGGSTPPDSSQPLRAPILRTRRLETSFDGSVTPSPEEIKSITQHLRRSNSGRDSPSRVGEFPIPLQEARERARSDIVRVRPLQIVSNKAFQLHQAKSNAADNNNSSADRLDALKQVDSDAILTRKVHELVEHFDQTVAAATKARKLHQAKFAAMSILVMLAAMWIFVLVRSFRSLKNVSITIDGKRIF